MPEFIPASLPEWAAESLRAPVASRAASRERIMQAVRALPAPRRVSAPTSVVRASRWFRRGSLTGAGGVLLTAMLALMVSVHRGEQLRMMSRLHTTAVILGDTVVPVAGAVDTVGARLLDTLRIVQFAIRGPNISAAEVIGSFNGWRRGSTMLRRVASVGDEHAVAEGGAWSARALVPRDALEFAYVIRDASGVAPQERRIPAAPLPAHN